MSVLPDILCPIMLSGSWGTFSLTFQLPVREKKAIEFSRACECQHTHLLVLCPLGIAMARARLLNVPMLGP